MYQVYICGYMVKVSMLIHPMVMIMLVVLLMSMSQAIFGYMHGALIHDTMSQATDDMVLA